MGMGGPGDSRMMGPHGEGGGATFATVKASAPNTIQYLPSRPQYSDTRPRGPPSLDFLHRFANPDKGGEPAPCSEVHIGVEHQVNLLEVGTGFGITGIVHRIPKKTIF